MENLETYIAFDLEFNTVDGISHIIQVSAVKLNRMRKWASLILSSIRMFLCNPLSMV